MSIYDIYRGTNDYGIVKQTYDALRQREEEQMLIEHQRIVEQCHPKVVHSIGYVCVNGYPVSTKSRVISFKI